MHLKLMERDTDGFRVIEITDCSLRRLPAPVAVLNPGTVNEAQLPLVADAFIVNDRGETVEKFFLKPNKAPNK